MSSQAVRLYRVFKSTPEKIYRAFMEPAAMVKWIPPRGFTAEVIEYNTVVGGRFRMQFTNFGTKKSSWFGGEFLELEPGRRIRYTDRFDDPALPGQITTTVMIEKKTLGTELVIIQEGIPAVIPADACYLGWQESLDQLAMLVEPEIPDGP